MRRIQVNHFNLLKFLIISFLFFSSCEKNDDDDKGINNELSSSSWIIDYFIDAENNEIIKYQNEKKMELVFTNSDTVKVSGYCNGGTGTYEVTEESIYFYNIIMTEKGCSPIEMNDFENIYINSLNRAKTYELSNDTLKIISDYKYSIFFYRKN